MADEISDSNFKSEMMRLMSTAIQKVDGIHTAVGENTNEIRSLKADIISLKDDVKLLTGRFEDVAGVVIKDTQRLTNVEHRVDTLEGEAH